MLRLVATTFLIFILTSSSIADEVPDNEKVDIDLRRTTIVVSDMEKSLAFYRDALGLKVIYDQSINSPRGASNEDAEIARRLVFLRANDDYIGIIGLLQYIKPERPLMNQPRGFNPGGIVLVFNTEDLNSRFEKIRQLDFVEIVSEPSKVTYPGYGGKGTIEVMVSVLYGPDGTTIELNQILGSSD